MRITDESRRRRDADIRTRTFHGRDRRARRYADCVTCHDGYELDVLYDDCTGACVKNGWAVNPLSSSACRCYEEQQASVSLAGAGSATCAPTGAPSEAPTALPTAFDGTTEVTFYVNSTVVLDGIAVNTLKLSGPAREALQQVLVDNSKHRINSTRAVTRVRTSSYRTSTRVDYGFYVWAQYAGLKNSTEKDALAEIWLGDYEASMNLTLGDGSFDALLAASSNDAIATATANATATKQLLYASSTWRGASWRSKHVTFVDATQRGMAATLRVTISSVLTFDNATVDAEAFNDDATAVSEFKELVACMWPNITSDDIGDVSATEDDSSTAISFSFDDYVELDAGASLKTASNESDAYKSSFVTKSAAKAGDGTLQTCLDGIVGRRRLASSSSAFSSAAVDPAACQAALQSSTESSFELLNSAPTSSPTKAPTFSKAPTTYTPTTSLPTYAPSYAPTSYEPTDAPSEQCDDDACWDDDSVAAFDCADYPDPIQVLRYEDEDIYSVREWTTGGAYVYIHDLDFNDEHVNAVGMFEGASGKTQRARRAEIRLRWIVRGETSSRPRYVVRGGRRVRVRRGRDAETRGRDPAPRIGTRLCLERSDEY